MKKKVLVFGLLSGLVITAMMVVSTTMCVNDPNFEGSMILGYAGMLLAFSLVFIGIKQYRDKDNAGIISFGKAFKIGIFIALISSTFYVLSWLVEYYCFFPDFMEKYTASVLAKAQKAGADAAELAKQTADMQSYVDMYKSPLGVILLTYMEVLPIGIIATLISALVLKRKVKK